MYLKNRHSKHVSAARLRLVARTLLMQIFQTSLHVAGGTWNFPTFFEKLLCISRLNQNKVKEIQDNLPPAKLKRIEQKDITLFL